MAQEIQNDLAGVHPAPSAESDVAGINPLLDMVGSVSHHIALLTAWVAMSGSLYFSEVLRWTPCLLCWYQRIIMYPLAAIIAIGILRRDTKLHFYVLPFSIFGMGMSLYHYLLIKTTIFPAPACNANIPCNVEYMNVLGFINIPFLALTAFTMITGLMIITALRTKALEASVYAEIDEQSNVDDNYIPEPYFAGATPAVFVIIGAVIAIFLVSGQLA
ncbi:MAG: disulfide bond formation protein B [Chloroflexi bacterium AL-W]|nr:disulfide bond formation protein B [Chloroflexi bacterium AL-N1]NOK69907.1 disulfide bond formation protein B [Chloroflexi bacterium AL-N10]NOK73797.1 disulfide bond formation protein B [Chloroflexi bacterium AL-N5]NOK85440.1 disulfide bond formation protein B [Chloroflexi bacterium AL-W]NOK91640.1 disulfide bond formation protein B [Chloroflexi bacterium AL-N15]